MNKLSEQALVIRKKINLFENRKIDLMDFVNDLGGLLEALESVDEEWKDNFQREINTLEMIEDSVRDGSLTRWTEDPKKVMDACITKLSGMVQNLLESYLKFSDPNVLENATSAPGNWLICPKCHDAWESSATSPMVICPNCESPSHNPRQP